MPRRYEVDPQGPFIFADSDFSVITSFRQTDAEIAAGVTPTNYAYAPLNVRRYGAVLDGATSDFTAIQNALTVAAQVGGRVYIDGVAGVASASLPFTVGSNTEIVGNGKTTSGITITGSATNNLFDAANKVNLRIADLTITGNSQANALGNGLALYFHQNTSAAAIGGSVTIERCRFTNFKGDYWLWFVNDSATYVMRNIWVQDNEFISATGNSRDPTLLTVGSWMVVFQGQSNGSVGLVQDTWVERNIAECTFTKGFGVAWQTTKEIHFRDNDVLNAGLTGANDDKAGYAFLCYNNSAGAGGIRPTEIYLDDNVIIAPRSAGLYCADVGRVFARRNNITGQTDTTDGTLPKGAIAFNGATYGEASDNTIDGCFAGVQAFGNTANDVLVVRGNTITNGTTNGYGVRIETTFSGKTAAFNVTGNHIDETGSGTVGITMRFTSAKGASRIVIKNNQQIRAVGTCLQLFSSDASVPDLAVVDISQNVVLGNGGAGLDWQGATDSEGRVSICGNKFAGTWGSASYIFNVQGSYNLTILDNEWCDMTSGTGRAFRGDLARGRLYGNVYQNVTSTYRFLNSGSEDLGLDTPTWTGAVNDVIQNLNVTEAGAAASKYMQFGWGWDDAAAAWKQMRALTGN